MSLYNINDIVYCTNTTWLHEQCKITEIVQNSTVPEETVYEAQSLSSQEVLLVSEDCVTLTPKLNIKQLRISTRLSQAKFAHKFEIPTRTLQKWEIGQSSPPPYVIRMIQQMLEQEKALSKYIDNITEAEAMHMNTTMNKKKLKQYQTFCEPRDLKQFSIEKFLFELPEEEKKIIIEKELSRLYHVLDKLQENPLPPMEELVSLLRIPENTCGIEPTYARASVEAEIIIYEAALKKLKNK